MGLQGFPLPELIRITGPIGQPLPLFPGQDRINWWGYITETTFIAIPPEVVDNMVAKVGSSVWNSLPGESGFDAADRVRMELNAAAGRMG